jgi:hypothetical protein
MAMSFLLMMAAAAASPVASPAGAMYPGNFLEVITPADYPREDLKAGRSAGTLVAYAIDPKGKLVQCRKMAAVGDVALSGRICAIVATHRYKPARRANGEPAYFIAHDMVKFFTPDTPQGATVMRTQPLPDMDLRVSGLPDGKKQISGDLLLDIDETGQATDCALAADNKEPGLLSLCSSLALFKLGVEHDVAGKPVRYVTHLRVRLSTAPEAKTTPR